VLGDGTPKEVIRGIVQKSAGNPFYLEELLRAHAAGSGAELPETLLAMVQSRLERFPNGARRILRAASVVGDTFNIEAVYALLGIEEDTDGEIEQHLQFLEDQEVIARRADAARPGEVEYVFLHDYFREAAAAMLTYDDRLLADQLFAAWKSGEDHPAGYDIAMGATSIN
jgi:predicted ATPase